MPKAASQPAPETRDFFTDKEKQIITDLHLKQFTKEEREFFFVLCERTKLDPITKQIYATSRSDHGKTKLVPVTSIEGLRVIAERTGEYRGQTAPQWCGEDGVWKDVWTSKGYPFAARIGVHRNGFVEPVYGIARFNAYAAFSKKDDKWVLNQFWAKLFDWMLAKCAEAQALRKAFPQQLCGLLIEEEVISFDDDGSDAEAVKSVASRSSSPEKAEPLSKKADPTKKAEPQAEKKPVAETPVQEPAKPEEKAPEPKAPEQQPEGAKDWRNFRLTFMTQPNWKDKQLGELSDKLLEILWTRFCQPQKTAGSIQAGSKQEELYNILAEKFSAK
jgi:phage recombination protein Bet